MSLAKEFVGSFLMGFFAALMVFSLLMYFFERLLLFAVSVFFCAVSIALLYFVDLRAAPKVTAKLPAKDKRFRYCYDCGAENYLQAEYCHKCGSKLG